jgi:hypothetical protein
MSQSTPACEINKLWNYNLRVGIITQYIYVAWLQISLSQMVPKLLNFTLSQLQRSESWRKKKGVFFYLSSNKVNCWKGNTSNHREPLYWEKAKDFLFLIWFERSTVVIGIKSSLLLSGRHALKRARWPFVRERVKRARPEQIASLHGGVPFSHLFYFFAVWKKGGL